MIGIYRQARNQGDRSGRATLRPLAKGFLSFAGEKSTVFEHEIKLKSFRLTQSLRLHCQMKSHFIGGEYLQGDITKCRMTLVISLHTPQRQQCKLHKILSVDSQEIIKIAASRCHILRLKRTKIAGGTYSAPQTPNWISEGLLLREERGKKEGGTGREREGEGRKGK